MPPVGFNPKFSADERPKTCALDRAVTGTDNLKRVLDKNYKTEITFIILCWVAGTVFKPSSR